VGGRWILFALALLVFNFYVGSRSMQPVARVRVPYSPFFLEQVRVGHVKEITSKGTAIQGTFTQKLRYAGSKPTTRFRTEIPAFADNNALSRLLQQKGAQHRDQKHAGLSPQAEMPQQQEYDNGNRAQDAGRARG